LKRAVPTFLRPTVKLIHSRGMVSAGIMTTRKTSANRGAKDKGRGRKDKVRTPEKPAEFPAKAILPGSRVATVVTEKRPQAMYWSPGLDLGEPAHPR